MKHFLYLLFSSIFFALLAFAIIQIQDKIKRDSYLKGFESGVSSIIIPTPISFPEKGCITGDFLIEGWIEDSFLQFGEIQLCAEIKDGKIILGPGDLIVGPDFSTIITTREDEISKWKDCADSILLCPEGFKRSESK